MFRSVRLACGTLVVRSPDATKVVTIQSDSSTVKRSATGGSSEMTIINGWLVSQ